MRVITLISSAPLPCFLIPISFQLGQDMYVIGEGYTFQLCSTIRQLLETMESFWPTTKHSSWASSRILRISQCFSSKYQSQDFEGILFTPLPPCSKLFECTGEGCVSGFTGGETEKPFRTPGIRCVVGKRFNAVSGEQVVLRVIFPILCSLVHSSALRPFGYWLRVACLYQLQQVGTT